MSSGYLTLDLRELKSYQDKIYKKGIYQYILNTKKPIEIILPKFLIGDMSNSNGALCNTFRINATSLRPESEFGKKYAESIYLPIMYEELYDNVKDEWSIAYAFCRCMIYEDDTISVGQI